MFGIGMLLLLIIITTLLLIGAWKGTLIPALNHLFGVKQ